MLQRVTFLNRKSQSWIGDDMERFVLPGLVVLAAILALNQYLIWNINPPAQLEGPAEIGEVDVTKLSSTAATIAAVFPELREAKSEKDVMRIMLPSGTPEYSKKLGGISFDNVEASLNYLASLYPRIKEEVKKDPELWKRYMNLASRPVGISCEFCCGVGPVGVDKNGELRCGCKHNPALHALVLGLIKYTNYSDAQILREVMKWKTAFYPKDMVSLGLQVAGKSPEDVASLPGMVGGC